MLAVWVQHHSCQPRLATQPPVPPGLHTGFQRHPGIDQARSEGDYLGGVGGAACRQSPPAPPSLHSFLHKHTRTAPKDSQMSCAYYKNGKVWSVARSMWLQVVLMLPLMLLVRLPPFMRRDPGRQSDTQQGSMFQLVPAGAVCRKEA